MDPVWHDTLTHDVYKKTFSISVFGFLKHSDSLTTFSWFRIPTWTICEPIFCKQLIFSEKWIYKRDISKRFNVNLLVNMTKLKILLTSMCSAISFIQHRAHTCCVLRLFSDWFSFILSRTD